MTKAEAKQIDNLLTELVRAAGMNVVNAVKIARQTLARSAEGQILTKQLKIAQEAERLPECRHGRPLMDWSGEQLVPPCGCRLVEPTAGHKERRR
jgi:hypothetical protein